MISITPMASFTAKLLGKQKIKDNAAYRYLLFCTAVMRDDGILLYNGLTKELISLSLHEYEHVYEYRETYEYLINHWFMVQDSTNDKELADKVLRFARLTDRNKDITTYTILTTTDCNAHCFYCYEKGRKKRNMTADTAYRTAQFIREHCGNNKVKLTWFGGEPLLNTQVIDIICKELRNVGIEYKSVIVSNGYYFTNENVAQAVNLWNLERVQITIDGTRDVYLKAKAYEPADSNAYDRVFANIKNLLDKEIKVNVRMNMDKYNSDNLFKLTDEMSEYFEKSKGLSVYPALLFENGDKTFTPEHSEYIMKKHTELIDILIQKGLYQYGELSNRILTNHCIADSDNAVVISTEGDLGKCEHFSDDHFFGNIFSREIDENVISQFKESGKTFRECETCDMYADCSRLLICSDDNVCTSWYRQRKRKVIEESMKKTFEENKKRFTIKLAEHYFQIYNNYDTIKNMCKDYIAEGHQGKVISVNDDEILAENSNGESHSKAYLETLAVYRKICETLIPENIILMHGSAVKLDDDVVLFTAPSGTGKSTHANLWKEHFGDRLFWINDDKPLISINDGEAVVYGTPWSGKHSRNTNTSGSLKAVYILEQAPENELIKSNFVKEYSRLFNQVYRPKDTALMKKTMELFKQMFKDIPVYILKCNISDEAVVTAYEAIR